MRSTTLASYAGVFLAVAASALVPRAAETDAGRLALGLVPAPAPTSPPRKRYPDLFERQINSDATCGYFYSFEDPNSDTYPVTCASGRICTVSGQMRNCCSPGTNCATAIFPTTCLDREVCPYLTETAWPPGTMCCEDTTYPYCQTNLWSTTPGDTYTFFGCHRSTTSRFGVIEAFPNGAPTSTVISELPEPTTTGNPFIPDTTTTDPTQSTTTTPTPTPIPDGGGSNTGAIVGGVVGGSAVIGIVVLGLVFLIKKKKKPDIPPAPAPAPQPNNGFQSPPNPSNPPRIMSQQTLPYDARQSYVGAHPIQSPTKAGGYGDSGGVTPTSPYGPPPNMTPPQAFMAMGPQQPGTMGGQPQQYHQHQHPGGISPPQNQPYTVPPPAQQVAAHPPGLVGGNNPVEMNG